MYDATYLLTTNRLYLLPFSTGNAQFVPPPVESTLRMARLKPAYIRQMTEANLLIPGRSLNLMDIVGQGAMYIVLFRVS